MSSLGQVMFGTLRPTRAPRLPTSDTNRSTVWKRACAGLWPGIAPSNEPCWRNCAIWFERFPAVRLRATATLLGQLASLGVRGKWCGRSRIPGGWLGIAWSGREAESCCRAIREWSSGCASKPKAWLFATAGFGWRNTVTFSPPGAGALGRVGLQSSGLDVWIDHPDAPAAEIFQQILILALAEIARPHDARRVDLGVVVDPLQNVGGIRLGFDEDQVSPWNGLERPADVRLVQVRRMHTTPGLVVHLLS